MSPIKSFWADFLQKGGTLVVLALMFISLTGFSVKDDGMEDYKAGRYDRAEDAYRKAAEDNPGDAAAHYDLGDVYYRTGRYDQALKEFDEAARLDPKMAEAYYNGGDSLYRLGKYEEALKYFQQADSAKKSDPDTAHNINITLEKVKREKERKQEQQRQSDKNGKSGPEKKGQGSGGSNQGREQKPGGQSGQGQGGGQRGPSDEEVQAMMDRQKKEEKGLRNYFRPGKKDEASGRQAQIEQILRAAGMQVPGRPARPNAPRVEKDW